MAVQLHPWNSSTPWKPTKLSGIANPRVLVALIVSIFIGILFLYFAGLMNPETYHRLGLGFIQPTWMQGLVPFFIIVGLAFIFGALLSAIAIEIRNSRNVDRQQNNHSVIGE